MNIPGLSLPLIASGTSAASLNPEASSTTAATAAASTNTIALPDRPTSLNDVGGGTTAGASSATPLGTSSYGTSALGTGGYGTSGYGGSGYGSLMYGSGGYGSSMYGSGGFGSSMYGGGYGGLGGSMYGGGYGGYGSSMYGGGYGGGYGGYGGGYGMMNQGMGPGANGLLGEGTQATFHLIESIIGAVGGFAQMLEATYMATHSSFFTMVSLAEQFGNLKNALGSLLGIFALIKFLKKIFYKLTGQNYNNGLNIKEFNKFEKTQKKLEENIKKQHQQQRGGNKLALKPLLLFLAAAIGFPYLLSKAIQKLNQQQVEQRRRQEQLNGGGNMMNPQQGGGPLNVDLNTVEFAKAIYEFNPENPNVEIELKPNELVAILSKCDPLGNESKWWKVRSRLGKVGYVPSNYLALIERKTKAIESTSTQPTNQSAQTISELPLNNNLQADKMVQDFHDKSYN
ncbi:Peroxisomal membrane protein PAS20 [Scheffersomyces spartinae]|uniref:Peroxisomal membrane protein PEX13 n=1 Tax=Scheffersomyces spartinae TaxID=45513 RepID=A0A9P7VAJ8_9ASCO|nr:Peroxisomal membrane protein PAS20 [Scheffersomyces spartinae]KAG7194486.1 Peroxisomal membrane protein PAS20 [Scheffersomyces spartinae]